MSSTIVTHTGGTEYTRASTVLPSSSLCAASRFFCTLNSLSSMFVRGPRLCVRSVSRYRMKTWVRDRLAMASSVRSEG